MKILVADDSPENLVAARKAAENFPEIKFVFASSARGAVTLLGEVDAVVTDLFFPDEDHKQDKTLGPLYERYCVAINWRNPVVNELNASYYSQVGLSIMKRLQEVQNFLKEGVVGGVVERLMSHMSKKDPSKAQKFQKELDEGQHKECPYGAAIMLGAKALGKKHCLVSDIHRHATDAWSTSGAIDAYLLLMPLISEGVLTLEQVKWDGRDSLVYLGHDEIPAEEGKADPRVWIDAFSRVLAQ